MNNLERLRLDRERRARLADEALEAAELLNQKLDRKDLLSRDSEKDVFAQRAIRYPRPMTKTQCICLPSGRLFCACDVLSCLCAAHLSVCNGLLRKRPRRLLACAAIFRELYLLPSLEIYVTTSDFY